MRRFLVLFLAQGLFVGRFPIMPGTVGSVVGVGWMGLLLWSHNFWIFLSLALASVLVSVLVCEEAEHLLRVQDPGSVVLDEIVAIPFCYLPWIGYLWMSHHHLPSLSELFSGRNLLLSVAVFVLFRILDMVKPWPIRQSQNFSGGWGVTLDDLLAAAYIAALEWVVQIFRK